MSFAFQTVKDSWSDDKRTRELKEVRLYDVSVVTYPAYEETVAELRNRNNTQADTVTDVAPILLRKRQIQLRQAQAEN
jgi:phage head maturation protease